MLMTMNNMKVLREGQKKLKRLKNKRKKLRGSGRETVPPKNESIADEREL